MPLASSYATADTIRIGDRIITTGMSTAEVIDRAGQPSRTIQLENTFGAGVGERWEYYRGKKLARAAFVGDFVGHYVTTLPAATNSASTCPAVSPSATRADSIPFASRRK